MLNTVTLTNSYSLYANANLNQASLLSQRSISSISSGQRIVNARDDVAGLALGTVLKTNVSTLRTALSTAGQAQSLLGVADGALNEIANILARQKSLASQASSGTLDSSARSFLNQEFQELKNQIDSLVNNTNFNGIKLLLGLTNAAMGKTNIADAARGENTITLTADANDNDQIVINGVFFKEGTSTGDGSGNSLLDAIGIGVGTTSSTFMANLLVAISAVQGGSHGTASTSSRNRLNAAEYTATSALSLRVQARTGGGQNFTIGDNIFTGRINFTTASGGNTISYNRLSILSAGANGYDGLGGTTYRVGGTIGDSILTSYSTGTSASETMTISGSGTAGDTLTINGTVISIVSSGATGNQVNVGATSTEFALNLLQFLNRSNDINIAQATYFFDPAANYITIAYNSSGDVGNNFIIEKNSSSIDLSTLGSSVFLLGGVNNTGINTFGLSNNKDFAGKITGFTATYLSDNRASISVSIGSVTYTAANIVTNPTSARFIRFIADKPGGGFFDLELAAGGMTIGSQTDANTLASRINSALSNITFSQDRQVTNFTAAGDIFDGITKIGSLVGSRFQLVDNTYRDLTFESVKVTAPIAGGTNAKISIVLNGETYEATVLNATLYKGETLFLINQSDSGKYIKFTNGNYNLTLASSSNATAAQEALEAAFGIGEQGNKLYFQLGTDASGVIGVGISSATTSELYDGLTLDLLSEANAAIASTELDLAIAKLTSIRAEVGSYQSRFDFATDALEESIINQDEARGKFLDADISEESVSFASTQVLVQAGISIIAQANQLPNDILRLISNSVLESL